MIAVENQRQPVNEMAQFCAAEIILRVYSSDRGKLGNNGSSAYAHVFDTTGKKNSVRSF